MGLIFNSLCFLLSLIGQLFNCSYTEISVYICIYLWPILCIISTLPIILVIIYNITAVKKILYKFLYIILLIISYLYSMLYYTIYTQFINYYKMSPEWANSIFSACKSDLIQLATENNISYATINIYIYVYLFLLIIIINNLIAFILNKLK